MFYKKNFRSFTKTKNFSNISVSIFFILTILLIIFNKADYFIVNKLKLLSVDIVSPATKIISFPVDITFKIGKNINEIRFLKKENLKLKEELIRLKKWQTLAIKTERENQAYKKLLNSTNNQVETIKTAFVRSQSPGLYAKMITINAGMNDGIVNDLTVINERGLVGKIISVSQNNSKIILINDQNSAVPVKNMSNNFLAIVKGTPNGKYLTSSFIKGKNKPKEGDLLVTSGSTSHFPSDILVGKIIKVEEDNFYALPYVDFDNLEFVQVIDKK